MIAWLAGPSAFRRRRALAVGGTLTYAEMVNRSPREAETSGGAVNEEVSPDDEQ